MSYDELMLEYQKMKFEKEELMRIVQNQQLEINSLKRMIFGQKREYTPKKRATRKCYTMLSFRRWQKCRKRNKRANSRKNWRDYSS